MSCKLALSVVAVLVAVAATAAATTDPEATEPSPVADVCEFVKKNLYHDSVDLDCSSMPLVCSKLSAIFECNILSSSVISIDLSNKNLTKLPEEIAYIDTLTKL